MKDWMRFVFVFSFSGFVLGAAPSALADVTRSLSPASPGPAPTGAYVDPDFRYDLRVELPILAVGLGGWIATEALKPQLAPQTCRLCDRAPDGRDALNPVDAGVRQLLLSGNPAVPDQISNVTGFGLVPLLLFRPHHAGVCARDLDGNRRFDAAVSTGPPRLGVGHSPCHPDRTFAHECRPPLLDRCPHRCSPWGRDGLFGPLFAPQTEASPHPACDQHPIRGSRRPTLPCRRPHRRPHLDRPPPLARTHPGPQQHLFGFDGKRKRGEGGRL